MAGSSRRIDYFGSASLVVIPCRQEKLARLGHQIYRTGRKTPKPTRVVKKMNKPGVSLVTTGFIRYTFRPKFDLPILAWWCGEHHS
jgi:hypothetical protein